MKALLGAAIAFGLAAPVVAQPRYDQKLEEAVMEIVASKMGNIRGGFALDTRPVMVVVQDDIVRGTTDMKATRPAAPPEGMARAVERTTVPLSAQPSAR